MNTLQVIACVVLATAAHASMADTVNECQDASGKTLMTDRPCNDPAANRPGARPLQRPIQVENMPIDDIFKARNMIRDSASPDIGSNGAPAAAGKPPADGMK